MELHERKEHNSRKGFYPWISITCVSLNPQHTQVHLEKPAVNFRHRFATFLKT